MTRCNRTKRFEKLHSIFTIASCRDAAGAINGSDGCLSSPHSFSLFRFFDSHHSILVFIGVWRVASILHFHDHNLCNAIHFFIRCFPWMHLIQSYVSLCLSIVRSFVARTCSTVVDANASTIIHSFFGFVASHKFSIVPPEWFFLGFCFYWVLFFLLLRMAVCVVWSAAYLATLVDNALANKKVLHKQFVGVERWAKYIVTNIFLDPRWIRNDALSNCTQTEFGESSGLWTLTSSEWPHKMCYSKWNIWRCEGSAYSLDSIAACVWCSPIKMRKM